MKDRLYFHLVFNVNVRLALWLYLLLLLHLNVQIDRWLENWIIVVNHTYRVAWAARVPWVIRFTDWVLRKLFDRALNYIFLLLVAQLIDTRGYVFLVLGQITLLSVLWVITSRWASFVMGPFLLFFKVFLLNFALDLLFFCLLLWWWLLVQYSAEVSMVNDFFVIVDVVLVASLGQWLQRWWLAWRVASRLLRIWLRDTLRLELIVVFGLEDVLV